MKLAFALVLGTIALTGCAHRRSARLAPAPPPPPFKPSAAPSKSGKGAAARSSSPLLVETGVASWYGYPYHGRRAANGEVYDMEQMTAAHRTLPFDTLVRVVNLNTEQSVEV